MDYLKIDLRELERWFQNRFPSKDIITFDDLMYDYETLISENDDLKMEIEELNSKIKDLENGGE